MNIRKYRYGTAALLFALAACSSEQPDIPNLTPGDTPIELFGVTTRADGTVTGGPLKGYNNLYLSAKTGAEGNRTEYFSNSGLTVGDKVTNEEKNLLGNSAYYPLGETTIYLYGHTGTITDNKMSLISGKEPANDYLISNGDDGKGTEASSANNKKSPTLTFRHVMTKLEVAIDVTDNELQETKPTDIQIEFGNKVPNKGTYDITTNPTNDSNNKATANDASGNYKLNVGTHYLVPTGETLSGTQKIITSLKIDDYTATAEDLTALMIPKVSKNGKETESDLVLKPGLAYKLTFKIKRLKVVDIQLTMKEWKTESGDGSWGYSPYEMSMDFNSSGYTNTGDAKITKVVLKHTVTSTNGNGGDGTSTIYQYIGGLEGDKINFVTLPAGSITEMSQLKLDLYTKNGLLISDIQPTSYTAPSSSGEGKIGISLGAKGMTKDNSDYYEVSTPLQFYNMMTALKEATANGRTGDSDNKYKLTDNINIDNLPLSLPASPDFPAGAELDGNSHSILHLKLEGNGLFGENKGTLKNVHIAFSSIDATEENTNNYVGSICSINSGKIEGCINEADITASTGQTVGGICGKNTGTILACLNTGNIPNGAKIGGICGENASATASAIKACINAGMLHGSSNSDRAVTGGICGYQSATSSNSVIANCYWLTGTASNDQTFNDEKAIGSFADGIQESAQSGYCTNTTNMTETELRSKAVTELNKALGTSSDWKFEWENTDGVYTTVWPIPVKNTTTTP